MKLSFWTTLLVIVSMFLACRPNTPAGTNTAFANTTDYICGMEVKPGYTDTCHYQGKVYGFCSASCRDQFKENPEQYLKK